MPKAETKRLFFALWPSPAVAAKLGCTAEAAHLQYGGRIMRRETLHLTLAFLGAVPLPQVATVHAAADHLGGVIHRLSFERLGKPRKKSIVWAAADTPPELQFLVERLHQRLRAAGFTLEDRAFRPHVTLLRNAHEPQSMGTATEFAPIIWPVNELVLVESLLKPEGASYHVIGRWPLASR